MDVSENQRLANQENGKKGGVKTATGKERSRRNATKHGVLGKLKTKYDPIDIDKIFQSLKEEYGGKGLVHQLLLEQLAITYVRLLRCGRFEAEAIKEVMNPPEYERVQVMEPLKKKFNFDEIQNGKMETRLVNKNDMAVLQFDTYTKMDLILSRYEPVLFSRFMKLVRTIKEL